MKLHTPFLIALIGFTSFLRIQPRAAALDATEVNRIAKAITVRIDSQTPGSGVIIQRTGDVYSVLTAAHVVATEDDYQVVTLNGSRYSINPRTLKRLPGVDLAILQFTSPQSYRVVKLGDSNLVSEGSESYVAGFPNRTIAINETIYNFTAGKITANASRPLADGYSLVYSNNTLPGMSGGPVLDGEGNLLGIHGRADATAEVQDPTINHDIYIKTGFNLGIPVTTFLTLVPNTGVELGFDPPQSPKKNRKSQGDDLYLRALDKYTKGDLQGVIADSTQVIRLNSAFAPAYSLRGSVRLILEDQLGALDDFNRAIQLDANLGAAYMGRGLIQSSLGNTEEAINDYTEAIALNRNDARAYYNRGVVRLNQDQKSTAIQDLRKAADIFLLENNQSEYQRAIAAINIASKTCRQSIRTLCDR